MEKDKFRERVSGIIGGLFFIFVGFGILILSSQSHTLKKGLVAGPVFILGGMYMLWQVIRTEENVVEDRKPEPKATGTIQQGRTDEFGTLLEVAIQQGRTGEFGTLLEVAIQQGRTNAVKVLLEAGADPNVKDERGCTPLYNATRFGHIDVVKVLLEAGADLNAKVWGGVKVLSWAVSHGHTEIVKTLIELGVDPKVSESLLKLAADKGYTEIIQLFKKTRTN
jgi:hypothetical protein